MKRRSSLSLVLAAGSAFGVGSTLGARAQDAPDATAHHGKGAPDAAGAKATLAFDAAPADWKARPPEGKPYVCDYDLPAAEGDAEGARVNVLFYPMGFEDYRKKLVQHWTAADGTPLEAEDQKFETFEYNDLKVRVFTLEGTHSPKGADPKPRSKLVTAHVRGPGGQWNVWLIGPAKSVDKHRETYLKWLKTVRLVQPPEPVGETDAVREVRFVNGAPAHGVPSPWALTGYRIGQHALAKLGVTRDRSWETVVTLRSPREERFTCVLDGLLASTGASPGKLNLVLETVADEDEIEVVIVHKPTGRSLTYTLAKAFRDKIRGVETAGFPAAAKALGALPDGDVFAVVESAAK